MKARIEGTRALKMKLKSLTAKSKMDELLSKLAEIGVDTAKVHFNVSIAEKLVIDHSTSSVAHKPDIRVNWQDESDRFAITAEGDEVAFIEFGAGVYSGGGYPGERPDGIAGIGEYGQGKGKQTAWGFYRDGNLYITRGNPPANAMYNSVEEIKRNIESIAKETFR